MYTKDKSNRITLRLNDDQFNYVKSHADVLDVSPSEFLRMVINATMALELRLDHGYEIRKEGGQRRENEQAHINDQL